MSAVIEGLERDRLAAVKERDKFRAEVERLKTENEALQHKAQAAHEYGVRVERERNEYERHHKTTVELSGLTAEVERLTKERDEARAHSPHNYVHRALYEQWKERAERAEKERDEALAAPGANWYVVAQNLRSSVEDSKTRAEKAERELTSANQSRDYLEALLAEREERVRRLEKERDALKAALRDIVAIGERCNCDGYGGPCGCGDRAEDRAREALGEVES